MGSFRIEGGHKLHGEIIPQGAKNEAMQIICASLLTDEEVTIENLPNILDINNLIDLLKGMGVKVRRDTPDTVVLGADNINFDYFQTDEFIQKASRLRGSVMMIGPLLARFGMAYMPKPGGDKIGRRRLDTHVIGLQKLGAIFSNEGNVQKATAPDGLHGCYMLLDEETKLNGAEALPKPGQPGQGKKKKKKKQSNLKADMNNPNNPAYKNRKQQ